MAIDDILNEAHNYNIDVKSRDIYLHAYITNVEEDPGVDYRMASTLIKNLRVLDKMNSNPILIHMHSIGGNWNDGMAIYDAIKSCKSHVTILVYGQAESMSSIILQAADKRVMMPNSYFMCHFGSNVYEGNYLDVQNAAKFEEKVTKLMLDIYSESAENGQFFKDGSYSSSRIKNYIKSKMKSGDWYLTSSEAIEYGFADSILRGSVDSLR